MGGCLDHRFTGPMQGIFRFVFLWSWSMSAYPKFCQARYRCQRLWVDFFDIRKEDVKAFLRLPLKISSLYLTNVIWHHLTRTLHNKCDNTQLLTRQKIINWPDTWECDFIAIIKLIYYQNRTVMKKPIIFVLYITLIS